MATRGARFAFFTAQESVSHATATGSLACVKDAPSGRRRCRFEGLVGATLTGSGQARRPRPLPAAPVPPLASRLQLHAALHWQRLPGNGA
jgi:hypothetical protein